MEEARLHHLTVVALLIAALAFAALGSVLLFRLVWKTPGKARSYTQNSLLLGGSTAFLLLVAEAFVYQVAVYPDAFIVSLAAKRWYAEHWRPVNALGMRGPQQDCPPGDGLPILLVVGDSFTEGAGLLDYRDRFSEQLKLPLRDTWHVETLARAGWDTPEQTRQILATSCEPKRVLLAYVINDIKTAALDAGVPFHAKPIALPPTLDWAVRRSYLLNLVYYRFNHFYNGFFSDITNSPLLEAYENPVVWAAHVKQIEDLIAACKQRSATLDVMIFPHLYAVELTRPITEKVQRAFEERGVQVLNLSELFINRNARDLVVSSLDSHPNAATHQLIAEAIVLAFGLDKEEKDRE